MKIIKTVLFIFRLFLLYWGNRKMIKWMKKNEKYQDNNHYTYNERWTYSHNKVKKLINSTNVKIKIIGEENIPKSSCLITPNHVSNVDILVLMHAFGEERQFTAIGKISLALNKRTKGYFKALEGISLNPESPRDIITSFDQAGKWCKENKRGLIIFPEGTRNNNEDGSLNDFKPGAFALAKKFFLPIVPVTIIGTKKALNWRKHKNVEIILVFHKPLKQMQIKTLNTIKIAESVQSKIQKDLDKYSGGKVT